MKEIESIEENVDLEVVTENAMVLPILRHLRS